MCSLVGHNNLDLIQTELSTENSHSAATKIYHPMHGYDSTLKVIQESLTKLNTRRAFISPNFIHLLMIYVAYIDLYLLHSALSGNQKRLDSYRALVKERDEGRIKSICVSN